MNESCARNDKRLNCYAYTTMNSQIPTAPKISIYLFQV